MTAGSCRLVVCNGLQSGWTPRREDNNGITAECACPRKSGCVGVVQLPAEPILCGVCSQTFRSHSVTTCAESDAKCTAQVEHIPGSAAASTRAERVPAAAS
jgi:hypothetical protein